MSFLGFRATNDPHQIVTRGVDESKDDRHTPRALFDALQDEHRFTLDAAASANNALCPRFFDLASNGLAQSWAREVVWCNPPYSNLKDWVEKAIRETREPGGARRVVMLLPANRTEQRWWQEWIEPVRDRGGPIRTRFLQGRISFGKPGNEAAKYKGSCPFGSVLVIFDGMPGCE